MVIEVGPDERADRHEAQTTLAYVGERAFDELLSHLDETHGS